MDFIESFLEYNSGTECPKNYLYCAALSALATAAGRKFIIYQGRLEVRPNLYICLVGEQGNRKSFAKDQTRDLISEALLDYPIGADLTSRDDIIRLLSSEHTCRFYTTHEGAEVEWHPLLLTVDEFKHFVSYSPTAMISFIVEIFNKRILKCSTLKRGEEIVNEPCLNILACETPKWITENLKMGIITGGFGRRFILVNEPRNVGKIVPFPYLPPNGKTLWENMKQHLLKIHTMRGQVFSLSEKTRKMFVEWYNKNKLELVNVDPMLSGFLFTKDQQVLKICMLMELAKETPSWIIDTDTLEASFAFFDLFEPNLPKLFVAAGRNELAIPQHELLQVLESNGGIMPHSDLVTYLDREMSPMEQLMVLKHLKDSARIHEGEMMKGGIKIKVIISHKKYLEQTKKL